MGTLIGGDNGGARTAEANMGRIVSGEDGAKIQANGLPEIRDALDEATIALRRLPEVREAARGSLRYGNLLLAFLLDCLTRGDAELRKRAIRGLKILEHLKDSDVQVDLRGFLHEDFGSPAADPDREDGGDATRRPRTASGRPHARDRGQSKKTG